MASRLGFHVRMNVAQLKHSRGEVSPQLYTRFHVRMNVAQLKR